MMESVLGFLLTLDTLKEKLLRREEKWNFKRGEECPLHELHWHARPAKHVRVHLQSPLVASSRQCPRRVPPHSASVYHPRPVGSPLTRVVRLHSLHTKRLDSWESRFRDRLNPHEMPQRRLGLRPGCDWRPLCGLETPQPRLMKLPITTNVETSKPCPSLALARG